MFPHAYLMRKRLKSEDTALFLAMDILPLTIHWRTRHVKRFIEMICALPVTDYSARVFKVIKMLHPKLYHDDINITMEDIRDLSLYVQEYGPLIRNGFNLELTLDDNYFDHYYRMEEDVCLRYAKPIHCTADALRLARYNRYYRFMEFIIDHGTPTIEWTKDTLCNVKVFRKFIQKVPPTPKVLHDILLERVPKPNLESMKIMITLTRCKPTRTNAIMRMLYYGVRFSESPFALMVPVTDNWKVHELLMSGAASEFYQDHPHHVDILQWRLGIHTIQKERIRLTRNMATNASLQRLVGDYIIPQKYTDTFKKSSEQDVKYGF